MFPKNTEIIGMPLQHLRMSIMLNQAEIEYRQAGWYFPREPTNFVRRKFLKSQEILRNMSKFSKVMDKYWL